MYLPSGILEEAVSDRRLRPDQRGDLLLGPTMPSRTDFLSRLHRGVHAIEQEQEALLDVAHLAL